MERPSQTPHRFRSAWLALPVVILSAGFAPGCATPAPFDTSSSLPGASGVFETERDHNGNSWVEVEFEHLAPPARLNPPMKTYVLWAESNFGRQVLLGKLKPGDDQRASWQGTVPFDRFRLLVSAEDLPWPERPREPILLKTEYAKSRR